MSFNPFDQALFDVRAACMPCCTTPTECMCALLIPPFASPYADYATAAAEISSFVSNCIGWIGPDPSGYTTLTFSATQSGATLSMDVSRAWAFPPSGQTDMWASLSLGLGAVVTVTWTAGGDAGGTPFCSASLYSCDGTLVETVSNFVDGSPLVFSAIATAGEYFIKVNGGGAVSLFGGSSFCNADITCSSTYWVNPVIALWDDSGTTRKLWACPKLLLPPLTESTGTWYASCADAATVLTDALKVSNCVGYYEEIGSSPLLTSFMATDGGTSLSFSGSYSGASSFFGNLWGGINAVAGDTISIAFTGGHNASANIYDDTGALVQSLGPSTSTLVSSALPYTGRYTVMIQVFDTPFDPPPGFMSASATITSSGTMSVNPIAAAWDNGLTCPSYLNCGDPCP